MSSKTINGGLSSVESAFSDFQDDGIQNPTGVGRKVCTRKDFSALFDMFTTNKVSFPVTFSYEELFSEVGFTREMWTSFFNGFPGDVSRVYNHLFNHLESEINKKQALAAADAKRRRKEKFKQRHDRKLAFEMKKVDDLRTEYKSKLAAIAEGHEPSLYNSPAKKARVCGINE